MPLTEPNPYQPSGRLCCLDRLAGCSIDCIPSVWTSISSHYLIFLHIFLNLPHQILQHLLQSKQRFISSCTFPCRACFVWNVLILLPSTYSYLLHTTYLTRSQMYKAIAFRTTGMTLIPFQYSHTNLSSPFIKASFLSVFHLNYHLCIVVLCAK